MGCDPDVSFCTLAASKRGGVSDRSEGDRRLIRMVVVPVSARDTRPVINSTDAGTVVMRGPDKTDHTCGGCGAVILDGVSPLDVPNVMFRCNGCGGYNELRSLR